MGEYYHCRLPEVEKSKRCTSTGQESNLDLSEIWQPDQHATNCARTEHPLCSDCRQYNSNIPSVLKKVTKVSFDSDSFSIDCLAFMFFFLIHRSYPGWSNSFFVQKYANQLLSEISALPATIDTTTVFYAGYNSPWTLSGRHNEVGFMVVS